ncbi:hypothetical protein B14911_05636 [Bacillus sp. NRRL B-14911]|uniref:Uncharacterized protein n=1 Tax=Bacillus infantis NRRL B-14911 TaxID=1367477 RepID=U5LCG4_9BACI|nr:hypothetical protein N288_18310 [Bacillus infantis NRRL B-14911]EAR63969.1 hypothetical protein B14911_05636 [Bacillus sp. NRRL B-14911]
MAVKIIAFFKSWMNEAKTKRMRKKLHSSRILNIQLG